MIRFPLRTRHVADLGTIVANRAGRFFLSEQERDWSLHAEPQELVEHFLLKHGHAAPSPESLEAISHELQVSARDTVASTIDYLILVPTLRCNLSCSYCQVSRAEVGQTQYDWTEETLSGVLGFLDGLTTDSIKIEFQGGEPTLRLDLILAVINRCAHFTFKQFVICTNLSTISDELLALLARSDVFISTSLDGDAARHTAQRTSKAAETDRFVSNLERIIDHFGPGKVSALPTINQDSPPGIDSLIDTYLHYGLTSIYLRPINYQGFARKRHKSALYGSDKWWTYYQSFIERMIERNWSERSVVLEESYLSLCLRRMFRIGLDRHVDLRNPNPVAEDYLVIDYDGRIYPTDEARMLTRSGVVDLCIGDLWQGYESETRRMLNAYSTNHGDPDCDACVYQPFCGRDLVDDLSRYGRIDLPRHETFFCQKHLGLFDLCARLIYSSDERVQYSLCRWLGLSGDTLPELARLS